MKKNKFFLAYAWLILICTIPLFTTCIDDVPFNPYDNNPTDTLVIIDTNLHPADSIPEGWIELGRLKANEIIWAIAVDNGGNVYAAGGFTDASGYYDVVRWNGTEWNYLNLNANAIINSLAVDAGGYLYASGQFTDAILPNAGNRYVARWNGSSWSNIGNGNTYGGGNVTADEAGNIYYGLNKWDGSNWTMLCPVCSLNVSETYALVSNNPGTVHFAAGNFIDNNGFRYVEKCDGSNCWTMVGDAFANAPILALAMNNTGYLFASGSFTNGTFPTEGQKYVAAWNGGAWYELGPGLDASLNAISYLAYDQINGNLYASGSFQGAGGNNYTIAKWDGSTWSAVGNMHLDPAFITVDDYGNLYSVFAQMQTDYTMRFCVVMME